MYIFQLNSYSSTKHLYWIRANWKKILVQEIIIFLLLIFSNMNNFITEIISIFLILILVGINIPKKRVKIQFETTHRVIRMWITESIVILVLIVLNHNKSNVYNILICCSFLTPIIHVIANTINYPIEKIRK